MTERLYTVVIYRNEVEVDRWSPVPRGPGPAHYYSADIMMMKETSTGVTKWQRKEWQYWQDKKDEDIPKTLRLLALLE